MNEYVTVRCILVKLKIQSKNAIQCIKCAIEITLIMEYIENALK